MKIFENIGDYNNQCVRQWSLRRLFLLKGSSCQGGFSPHYMKEVSHYPYTLFLATVYLGKGFPSESETFVD